MNIAIVDAYYDISHRIWAEGWKRHSTHDIDIYSLPSVHWKWQIMGGTIALSQMINKSTKTYDLIVVTDMVHLPTFKSLLSTSHQHTALHIYFHENQITYPWSPTDQDVKLERDHHYGFINYISALAADQVYFNSDYHKDSFCQALPLFLGQFPSAGLSNTIETIIRKSHVLPIGLDLPEIDRVQHHTPTFLWNHRWEYDKNPTDFFEFLFQLKESGLRFELIVLGKAYAKSPDIFTIAKDRLSDEIIHFGYVQDRATYQELLGRANISLVTGYQDFFGISVVEAISAGCYPLLPDRLAYPEHIPDEIIDDHIYTGEADLRDKITKVIKEKLYVSTTQTRDFVKKYDWRSLIHRYDHLIDLS